LKLCGEEHLETLIGACNFASNLRKLRRFKEAKSMLLKVMPVALRIFDDETAIKMRMVYARTFYEDDAATLDDLSEAVNMLEETIRTVRRVFGFSHPNVRFFDESLREARVALSARETPPVGGA